MLRVLLYPRVSTAQPEEAGRGTKPGAGGSNPYSELFARALESRGLAVHGYSPGLRRPTSKPDVFHVHWPEQAASGRNRIASAAKVHCFQRDVRSARRAGAAIIWTGHNVAPHEATPQRVRAFDAFVNGVDGILHLSETGRQTIEGNFPAVCDRPTAVAPIADLAKWYEPLPTKQEARKLLDIPHDALVLCNFGRHRAYKGLDKLIQAFGESSLGAHAELLLAGFSGEATNPSIRSFPGFLSDNALVRTVVASDVVVLPFDRILHSASVILALGLNRKVLAPKTGSLYELQERVGPDWLTLYEGGLNARDIRQFTSCIPSPTERCPSVYQAGWDGTAEAAIDLYQRVLAKRHSSRGR